jgi:rhodanese-related sulfurtransferase
VDIYRYDESWEVDAFQTLSQIYNVPTENLTALLTAPSPATELQSCHKILDLRTAFDYNHWHLPKSLNSPLKSLAATTISPFFDSAVLRRQWLELESFFSQAAPSLQGTKVTLLCYEGDTSRVATSVLQAKGVEACNIRFGTKRLEFFQNVLTLPHSTPNIKSDKIWSDNGLDRKV